MTWSLLTAYPLNGISKLILKKGSKVHHLQLLITSPLLSGINNTLYHNLINSQRFDRCFMYSCYVTLLNSICKVNSHQHNTKLCRVFSICVHILHGYCADVNGPSLGNKAYVIFMIQPLLEVKGKVILHCTLFCSACGSSVNG